MGVGGTKRSGTVGASWRNSCGWLVFGYARGLESQKHGVSSELSKNCGPETTKPRFHALSARGDGKDEKAGRRSFGREEQAQAEMGGVAQTQRPCHRLVELQAERCRRPTGPVVAGF